MPVQLSLPNHSSAKNKTEQAVVVVVVVFLSMKLLSPPTTFHHQQQHYCSFFNAKLHFSLPLFLPSQKLKLKPSTFTRWVPRMDSTTTTTTTTVHHHHHHHHPQHHRKKKEKIIVIMGATGTGKSKLSIDLATRFNAEIINSDKIQVYKGLDITTNKIPIHERQGTKHHLLGEFDSELHGELTPSLYRSLAGFTVNDIVSRKKLPFLVGGSTSLIHAVLVDRFNPELNVFDGSNSVSSSSELRYNCCFLWVDVSLSLLYDYLGKRVDDMLDSGMFEELTQFYQTDSVSQPGITKAIGVPEFSSYFKRYPPRITAKDPEEGWDWVRRGVYEKAVREIKDNTCELAKRQIGKIKKLRGAGWGLQRLDATEAFRRVMTSAEEYERGGGGEEGEIEESRNIWERQVVKPSVKIVKRFLEE